MPELMIKRLASFCGMSEKLGRRRWPFVSKKLRNISLSWFSPYFSILYPPNKELTISIESKKTPPLCRGEAECTSRYHPDYGFRRISSALIAGIRPGRPGLAREWLPVSDTGPFSIRPLSGVSCADSFRLSQSQFQLTNGIVPEIRDLSRTDPIFQRHSSGGSAISGNISAEIMGPTHNVHKRVTLL